MKRSPDLLRNSIATASLVAAIINGKFNNHLPLDWQSCCYKDSGVNLETNTMVNWMIRATEIHLNILYDYRSTRKADHPKKFLRNYSGILVTDRYQVYHSLEKKKDDLTVAGCLVHAKRKYAKLVKTTGIPELEESVAAQGVKLISELFHLDGVYNKSKDKDRKDYRQRVVVPKVDAYFAWVKESLPIVPSGGSTCKALQYNLNQEEYLRFFLTDGKVPMDNNTAERAIRSFTLGRKNWVNVDSIRGAEASAIMYSL